MLDLKQFGDAVTRSEFRGDVRFVVSAERLIDVLTALKNSGFDYLADLAGIDYLHYLGATDRYGVVYCLANTETAERVTIKTHANDPDPMLPSAYSLWKGADWMEREVYDMFGVVFDGHPDSSFEAAGARVRREPLPNVQVIPMSVLRRARGSLLGTPYYEGWAGGAPS